MSGLTSQLNKLGLGSKAATVSATSTSTATSTAAAPAQSSLTAALASRPRHKKSISGGAPEQGFSLTAVQPTAPGSTGSQVRAMDGWGRDGMDGHGAVAAAGANMHSVAGGGAGAAQSRVTLDVAV